MSDSNTNFPLEVKNFFISWLQKAILMSIKLLAFLMTLVIIWSVLDVAYILYEKASKPPFLFVNIEDLLPTFGAFLAVLIAIEIFLNIILYLRKDVSHLRLVVATALMAIARKIIVLDYDHASPLILFGIGAIILALGIAYWLVQHAEKPRNQKSIIHSSDREKEA